MTEKTKNAVSLFLGRIVLTVPIFGLLGLALGIQPLPAALFGAGVGIAIGVIKFFKPTFLSAI